HWPEVLDSSVLESLLKGPSRLLRDVYKCLTAESSHQGADLQGTQACTEHQVRPILSLVLALSLSLSFPLSLSLFLSLSFLSLFSFLSLSPSPPLAGSSL